MTKDQFLADPLNHYFSPSGGVEGSIPPEWVREAWEVHQGFRDEVISALTRSVNKKGSLRLATEWVGHISPALVPDQVVRLYSRIRDSADRCETEWRPEFERLFPLSARYLPPVTMENVRRYRALGLFFAIKGGNAKEIAQAVAELKRDGVCLNDARLRTIEILDVAMFNCMINSKENDMWSALQVAQAEGMSDIERVLRNAGATE